MSAAPDVNYRPDIDALRAFAVLPVVLFHLDTGWLPGGFLGVDVFFVISGYLITGLLLRDLSGAGLDLQAFWRRRILRILPALLVVVLATFIAGHVLIYAPDRYMLAMNAAGALLSVGNITHWRNYGGYWSADATSSPFLHTWSLGVEEQFYVLYPVALLLVWRLTKKREWMLLLAGLVASVMLYAIALQRSPAAAFYLLPTRGWELLAGGVAAAANLRHLPGKSASTFMSLSGLSMVLGAYVFATEHAQAAGAVFAVSGATLVVMAGSPLAFARLRLTTRPVILIGLISYSVYLWHWPIIVLGQAVEVRHRIAISPALYFTGSLVLGWVSWRYIESPIRHDRRRWIPLGLLICTIGSALLIYSLRDFNSSERNLEFRTARWDGEHFSVNPVEAWPEFVRHRMRGVDVTPRPPGREEAYLHGIEHRHGEGKELDILVLGDSHGLMWAPAIDAAARELRLNIRYMVADGTPVFFDPAKPDATHDGTFFSQHQWSAFNRARLEMIRRDRPRVVVIGSAWSTGIVPVAAPLLREMVLRGSKVLLLEDAPDFSIGDRSAPSYMAYLGINSDAHGRAFSGLTDQKRKTDELETIRLLELGCLQGCTVVHTRDLYEDQESILLVLDTGAPVFIDDDHLSASGAMLAKPRFRAALAAALGDRVRTR